MSARPQWKADVESFGFGAVLTATAYVERRKGEPMRFILLGSVHFKRPGLGVETKPVQYGKLHTQIAEAIPELADLVAVAGQECDPRNPAHLAIVKAHGLHIEST